MLSDLVACRSPSDGHAWEKEVERGPPLSAKAEGHLAPLGWLGSPDLQPCRVPGPA